MYNISLRVLHGTFHGVRMYTHHNFVYPKPLNIGENISVANLGGKEAQVYDIRPKRTDKFVEPLVFV